MRKLFLFTIAVAISLVACDKKSEMLDNNTDSSVRSKTPVSNSIRYFESYDELSEEIDKVNSMSFDDLVAYEAELGFNSFGKLADMAYEEVAQYQDEYESIEEVRNAIAQYSDYLQLIEEKGEYSVETKLYRRGTKYIVNEDRMYQVQDTLIKILENVLVETHIDYYELLSQINDENYKYYDNNPNVGITTTICLKCPIGHCSCNGNNNPQGGEYIGKEKMNYAEKLIKVGGKDRWHKLIVIVRMEDASGNKQKPMYIFETRRKGITNGAYWAYGMNVAFDLTATFGRTSHPNGGNLISNITSSYNRNGTARTSGCGLCWTTHKGNFLETNAIQTHFDIGNVVFVTTKGYAKCSLNGVEINVPFNFN